MCVGNQNVGNDHGGGKVFRMGGCEFEGVSLRGGCGVLGQQSVMISGDGGGAFLSVSSLQEL